MKRTSRVARPSRGLTRRNFLRLGGAGLAGATLLGSGAMAGCGGSGGGGLTVASWNTAADALEEVVPLFNEDSPDVDVEVQYITTEYDQLIPRLQAGTGVPDVFSVAQQDFQNFMQRFPDQFSDLTERMSDRESEFAEVAWPPVVRDGRIFGVPWDIGPVAMYYRMDYFEQAGIDPESLTTYDAFIEAGERLQSEVEDVRMTYLNLSGRGTNPSDYALYLNQLGGSFLDEEGRISFLNEETERVMDLITRYQDAGVALDAPTYDDSARALTNGEVATSISPVWTVGALQTSAEDQQGMWAVAPMPAFEEGGSRSASLAGSVLVVSEQSQNKEAAFEFIRHALLTNPGQNIQWDYGLFPSWQPYWETDEFNSRDEYFETSVTGTFAESAEGSAPLDYGSNYLDFRGPLLDAYGAVLNGDGDVETAFGRAERRAAEASGLEVAS